MNIFSKIIKEWKEAWKDNREEQKSFQDHVDRENANFEKEEKEADFFKNNVLNSEIITKNNGSLPIKGHHVGAIIIDRKKKIVLVEIRQTEICSQIAFHGIGHLICENAEYEVGVTDINGGVFALLKKGDKLQLFLNHNRQGIKIFCNKIKMIDFKEQELEMDEFRNIYTGTRWGKYFSIKEKVLKKSSNKINGQIQKVRIKDLNLDGPIRNPVLPDGFIKRVSAFMNILREVHTMSLENTMHNFQKDMHPERELKIWENIAKTYQLYTTKNPLLNLEEKQDVFKTALDITIGEIEFNKIKKLTREQIKDIINIFKSL